MTPTTKTPAAAAAAASHDAAAAASTTVVTMPKRGAAARGAGAANAAAATNGTAAANGAASPAPKTATKATAKQRAEPKKRAPKRRASDVERADDDDTPVVGLANADGAGEKKKKRATTSHGESKLLHHVNIKALANTKLRELLSAANSDKHAHTGRDAARAVVYYAERLISRVLTEARDWTAYGGRVQMQAIDISKALEKLGFDAPHMLDKVVRDAALHRINVTTMSAWTKGREYVAVNGQVSKDATEAIRGIVAIHACHLIDEAVKVTIHAKRSTLFDSDVQVARRSMNDNDDQKMLPYGFDKVPTKRARKAEDKTDAEASKPEAAKADVAAKGDAPKSEAKAVEAAKPKAAVVPKAKPQTAISAIADDDILSD